jgi:hypothetical protein
MTQVPDNFPTYSSYSPKTLIQQVDVMKQCIRELQAEIVALKDKPKAEKKIEKKD